MILDALMPSAPVVVANPKAPPRGLMEAADAVRRLEQLYLVTDGEVVRLLLQVVLLDDVAAVQDPCRCSHV